MAHSVGEQAARAVKNSERKQVVENRTPEEIIKGIRGNLVAHLSITPSDIAFLLVSYDAAQASVDHHAALLKVVIANDQSKNEEITALKAQIAYLQAKIDWARQVYESENRIGTIDLSPEAAAAFTEQLGGEA